MPLTALATVALAATFAFADTQYEVIDLGALDGGVQSWAYDINNHGLITGASEVDPARGEIFGFLWRDGVMSELTPLDGQPHSRGFGLNDTDQWVVGQTYRINFPIGSTSGTFVSSEAMAPVVLDFLAKKGALSADLNNNATPQAVGMYAAGIAGNFYKYHAFTVPIDGSFYEPTDLNTLGGLNSWAYAINDRNQIVGGSATSDGPMHAFLYSAGRMTDLGTLGGTSSEARDINENGVIVGWAHKASGATHAMISDGAHMIDIGTLGGDYAMANGINNLNQVVGESSTAQRAHLAFVYDYASRTIRNLNDLTIGTDWTVRCAEAINDQGQIVGWGVNGRGETRALLLNPVTSALRLANPVPGIAGQRNTIAVQGATPNASVALVYGLHSGSTNVPGCQGVVVSMAGPRLVSQMHADANGEAIFATSVPTQARGRQTLLQAVEPGQCEVSNLVEFSFD